MVRSLPRDDLSLEYRSSQQDVEVVSGGAVFHLRTLPPEDFPKLPDPPPDDSLKVPAGAFVEVIGRVARSASRDETRPHLTGVLVTVERIGAAHGGHRLLPPQRQGDHARARRSAARWRPTCRRGRCRSWPGWPSSAEVDEIRVAARENQVVFAVGDTVLSSRLVEGRFPNYQQLLPESYEHELQRSSGRRSSRWCGG